MNDQKFSKSILSSPNRIKFGTLTLSTLSSGLTEVSMKPLSKSGSRGRVGHKARSRENLRMAFLEASPLGSRITSRIAVIISRGRGSEREAGFGGGVTNNSAHETLPPRPLLSTALRPARTSKRPTFSTAKPAALVLLASHSPRLRFKKVNQIDNEATIATRDSISNTSRIFSQTNLEIFKVRKIRFARLRDDSFPLQ